MKKYFSIKSLFTLSLLAVGFVSCKKDKPETVDQDLRLTKVASWNPATGTERVYTELTYDNSGKLTSVLYNDVVYTPTFANGKLSTLVGKSKANDAMSFTVTYNAEGRVTTVKNVIMYGSADNGSVRTYTYNSAGKISQISTLSPSQGTTPYVTTYTWNGENLATQSKNSGTLYTSEYVSYDTKINPYYVDGGVGLLMSGSPASKNNYLELKTTYAGTVRVNKVGYEYNAAGYATSFKTLDGSNEGAKYYYNK